MVAKIYPKYLALHIAIILMLIAKSQRNPQPAAKIFKYDSFLSFKLNIYDKVES